MSGPKTDFLSKLGSRLVIGLPMFWLLLFFLVPFLVVLQVSLADLRLAQPPFTPIFEWLDGIPSYVGDLENYEFLFSDDLYIRSYLNSVKIAFISSLACLIVGYPIAYVIARADDALRNTLLLLVILPFWTSSLLRIYALIGMYSPTGFINSWLISFGLISEPIQLMQTDFAVYSGIVITYLPLMVLPLYAALQKLDEDLLEASADLGAGPLKTFWQVTLPLSLPGILAGCLLVFIPAVGEYIIPALLGGSGQLMIGKTLWTEFFNNRDWPLASAVAMVMLAVLVIPMMLLRNAQSQEGRS
ncbi:MAG: ABC transporter permease subunit [Rhizobiaceae bacterium]|jgi:putrescine transport system permease protein|nr:ABC transporter permease subunit [Rhizobiaceae bacterium]